MHRAVRLGLYATLIYGVSLSLKQADKYFTRKQYENVTLSVIESKELKKLRRAYQIKRAEAEEDKKALSKYKYDP